MDKEDARRALRTLGELLASRGHHFELVAIGGSSLLLLDLAVRPTADVDVVALVEEGVYRAARPLPAVLDEAQAEVGVALGLGNQWLNPGPTDLLTFGLPEGFTERVETLEFAGLTVHLASRLDQISFKLYAAVDQGHRSKHFADLKLLEPTVAELALAARWVLQQDPSQGFRTVLLEVLGRFGVTSENL